MKIFLICPVRTETEKGGLDHYVAALEAAGHQVHYPPRDVDQTDDGIGLHICEMHREAMLDCDEVHVVWVPESKGSHFDLGMAFMLQAFKAVLIRLVRLEPHKSYGNLVLELTRLAREK